MAATQSLSIQNNKFTDLGFQTIVSNERIVSYSRGLDSVSEKNPILVLVHGYPSSAYMWRHLIPLLPKDAPLYVPDLPGYGGSKALENMDKLSVGNAILSDLKAQLKSTTTNTPIVLIGHDRGARISHRLTVSGFTGFSILGVCLIDIVPTCTQWQHYSSPVLAAKEVTGYFHWPFLANVSLATRMITAYGGSRFCTEMIQSWAGKNPTGLSALKSDDSLSVYGGFFENEEVVRATCEDYRHGASTDLEAQEEDQKAGRKIEKPLLLIYGKDFIGKRYDFGTVWNDWVGKGVEITQHGLGDGIGHFGAEEAPEECANVIGEWLKGLASKARL
ncbi:alpha/beta-hydrolase [Phaeosphaeriaceae sp. SRC1lsM3a]|nr:alpha/beta-hydrolase [Stagonospora sp. SRC1lsM3a]